jgi:hypothetical protein
MPSAQQRGLPAPGVTRQRSVSIVTTAAGLAICRGKESVRLELLVRRFFCAVPTCSQRIFCKRLPLVAPHAHRTVRLNQALQRISLALGGEGGAPSPSQADSCP